MSGGAGLALGGGWLGEIEGSRVQVCVWGQSLDYQGSRLVGQDSGSWGVPLEVGMGGSLQCGAIPECTLRGGWEGMGGLKYRGVVPRVPGGGLRV